MRRTDFPAPEFLARRQATPRWLQALLAVAVAAAALVAIDAREAWDERERAAAHLAVRLQASLDLARPAKAAAPSAGQIAVLERLAMPWPEVFAATEAASVAGVQWLALRSGSERKGLQLEGRLPLSKDPSAVVNALAAQPGWKDVVLNRLQSEAQGGVRFDIDARLE